MGEREALLQCAPDHSIQIEQRAVIWGPLLCAPEMFFSSPIMTLHTLYCNYLMRIFSQLTIVFMGTRIWTLLLSIVFLTHSTVPSIECVISK